jgi:hypothetical protein
VALRDVDPFQGELSQEPEDVVARLVSMLKQTRLQSPDRDSQQSGAKMRVYSTEELCEMSYEQLLQFQDNLNLAIVRTREKEAKCSICLDHDKDSVCVPCGHR